MKSYLEVELQYLVSFDLIRKYLNRLCHFLFVWMWQNFTDQQFAGNLLQFLLFENIAIRCYWVQKMFSVSESINRQNNQWIIKRNLQPELLTCIGYNNEVKRRFLLHNIWRSIEYFFQHRKNFFEFDDVKILLIRVILLKARVLLKCAIYHCNISFEWEEYAIITVKHCEPENV